MSMHAGLRIGGEEEDQVRAGLQHPTSIEKWWVHPRNLSFDFFWPVFFQDFFM